MPGVEGRSIASDAVVFSLKDGYVWASWPGASGSVRLGTYENVLQKKEEWLKPCMAWA